MNSLLLTILQGSQLLGIITNVGLDLALKIKALFGSLGNEITVNIHTTDATAVTANNDTITSVNAWLNANGFQPLPYGPDQAPDPSAK